MSAWAGPKKMGLLADPLGRVHFHKSPLQIMLKFSVVPRLSPFSGVLGKP